MRVSASFLMNGSILAGTAEHRLDRIETHLAVESRAPGEEVAQMVALAERMCFVLDAFQRPHTVARGVSLNGEPLMIPDQ